MVLGKKVNIFDWEWGRNLAPRDWQKVPCNAPFITLCLASIGMDSVISGSAYKGTSLQRIMVIFLRTQL